MSTSKSYPHLAHSGGKRAGVATRRWVSHRSATPNPPRCHRREPRVQTRVNLCSICAPGACCAAVSCGFLWFPVASCGLVTLAARHLLCAACGRAVCYVARVSTVYGSRGYGVRSFCATVPSGIAHRRYNFVRCSVDFYFDIGSSLTSARGRGRCGRAAPATNEACNHKPMHKLQTLGGLQRACSCCTPLPSQWDCAGTRHAGDRCAMRMKVL